MKGNGNSEGVEWVWEFVGSRMGMGSRMGIQMGISVMGSGTGMENGMGMGRKWKRIEELESGME